MGLFKFGINLATSKIKYLDTISIIIHNMDFLSNQAMPDIVGKLGIDEQKTGELIEIWNKSADTEFGGEFEN